MPTPVVPTLYFDITDVVHFARRNGTVRGIPRVLLNIIFAVSKNPQGQRILCLFVQETSGCLITFEPVFREDTLDAESFLGALREIGKYEKNLSISKRIINKITIYFNLSRKKMSRFSRNIKFTTGIEQDSILICLGATWFSRAMWDIAATHRENGSRVVQVVYDLIPIVYPVDHSDNTISQFSTWIDSALGYATEFICISKATAIDFKKYAMGRGHTPMVSIMPLANQFHSYTKNEIIEVPDTTINFQNSKFVLCVGSIEHRKNNLFLLKIWKDLLAEMGNDLPQLVFAGKMAKGSEECVRFLQDHPDVLNKVTIVESPSDKTLAWLYQRCEFTLYPSVYEGWGLPVGESAWFGKWCLASQASSIPEVCGEMMDYCDPHDAGQYRQLIQRALQDREYLEQKQQYIARSSLRTWRDTGENLQRILFSPGT